MSRFKNFEIAMSNFAPDLQSSYEDGLDSLGRAIKNGYVDNAKLKEEVTDAFSNPYFNWLKFVFDNGVLIADESEPITNEEARKYIRSLIWDYLFNSDSKPIA